MLSTIVYRTIIRGRTQDPGYSGSGHVWSGWLWYLLDQARVRFVHKKTEYLSSASQATWYLSCTRTVLPTGNGQQTIKTHKLLGQAPQTLDLSLVVTVGALEGLKYYVSLLHEKSPENAGFPTNWQEGKTSPPFRKGPTLKLWFIVQNIDKTTSLMSVFLDAEHKGGSHQAQTGSISRNYCLSFIYPSENNWMLWLQFAWLMSWLRLLNVYKGVETRSANICRKQDVAPHHSRL